MPPREHSSVYALLATIDLIVPSDWRYAAPVRFFGRFAKSGHMTFDELARKMGWNYLPRRLWAYTVPSENPSHSSADSPRAFRLYTPIDDPPDAIAWARTPDILITIATAGAGTGASAGSKGATRASKAVDRAVLRELTHISKALLT